MGTTHMLFPHTGGTMKRYEIIVPEGTRVEVKEAEDGSWVRFHEINNKEKSMKTSFTIKITNMEIGETNKVSVENLEISAESEAGEEETRKMMSLVESYITKALA